MQKFKKAQAQALELEMSSPSITVVNYLMDLPFVQDENQLLSLSYISQPKLNQSQNFMSIEQEIGASTLFLIFFLKYRLRISLDFE